MKMEYILAIGVALFVFLCVVLSFGLGIKYGLSIKNGSQPKIEPFKPILERKAVKEAEKKEEEKENAFKNLMSYKGETN